MQQDGAKVGSQIQIVLWISPSGPGCPGMGCAKSPSYAGTDYNLCVYTAQAESSYEAVNYLANNPIPIMGHSLPKCSFTKTQIGEQIHKVI